MLIIVLCLPLYRKEREQLFAFENKVRECEDVLDAALLKAQAAKSTGAISAPDFYRISEKIDALKKLQFAEEYEGHQDKETYEWIKYKVAADVGGAEEIEAFAMYEKIKLDELGDVRFKLLKDRAHDSAFNI